MKKMFKKIRSFVSVLTVVTMLCTMIAGVTVFAVETANTFPFSDDFEDYEAVADMTAYEPVKSDFTGVGLVDSGDAKRGQVVNLTKDSDNIGYNGVKRRISATEQLYISAWMKVPVDSVTLSLDVYGTLADGSATDQKMRLGGIWGSANKIGSNKGEDVDFDNWGGAAEDIRGTWVKMEASVDLKADTLNLNIYKADGTLVSGRTSTEATYLSDITQVSITNEGWKETPNNYFDNLVVKAIPAKEYEPTIPFSDDFESYDFVREMTSYTSVKDDFTGVGLVDSGDAERGQVVNLTKDSDNIGYNGVKRRISATEQLYISAWMKVPVDSVTLSLDVYGTLADGSATDQKMRVGGIWGSANKIGSNKGEDAEYDNWGGALEDIRGAWVKLETSIDLKADTISLSLYKADGTLVSGRTSTDATYLSDITQVSITNEGWKETPNNYFDDIVVEKLPEEEVPEPVFPVNDDFENYNDIADMTEYESVKDDFTGVGLVDSGDAERGQVVNLTADAGGQGYNGIKRAIPAKEQLYISAWMKVPVDSVCLLLDVYGTLADGSATDQRMRVGGIWGSATTIGSNKGEDENLDNWGGSLEDIRGTWVKLEATIDLIADTLNMNVYKADGTLVSSRVSTDATYLSDITKVSIVNDGWKQVPNNYFDELVITTIPEEELPEPTKEEKEPTHIIATPRLDSKGVEVAWKNPTAATLAKTEVYRIENINTLPKYVLVEENNSPVAGSYAYARDLFDNSYTASTDVFYKLVCTFEDGTSNEVTVYTDAYVATDRSDYTFIFDGVWTVSNGQSAANATKYWQGVKTSMDFDTYSGDKGPSLHIDASSTAELTQYLFRFKLKDGAFIPKDSYAKIEYTIKSSPQPGGALQARFSDTTFQWHDTVAEWTTISKVVKNNAGEAAGKHFEIKLSHGAGEYWIDDVAVYECDADGNLTTGNNLITRPDEFFTDSYYAENPVPTAPVISDAEERDGGVDISWRAVDRATGYEVYEKDDEGKLYLRADVPSSITTVRINNLINNQSYDFVVKAKDVTTKGSDFSSVVTLTPVPDPFKMSEFKVEKTDSNLSVSVDMTNGAIAEGFSVQLIIAIYENGEITSMYNVAPDELRTVSMGETKTLKATITLPDNYSAETHTVKAFVWDSVANMKPYIGATTLQF